MTRPLFACTDLVKRYGSTTVVDGLSFAIAPGDPAHSFLIYRLESTDPGIAMPEVGRSTVHREGAALLRQWIAEMPKASH